MRLAGSGAEQAGPIQPRLSIRQDQQSGTISVFRAGGAEPILTQNARPRITGPTCIRSPRPTARAC